MRELKFRAWNGDSYIELNNLRGERSIYFSPYDLGAIPPEIRDKVALEQYTGLKDKNGKEIYEGDIVDTQYHNLCTYKGRGVVEMGEMYDSDGYNNEVILGWCAGGSSLLDVHEECTVIGNIYENPELLEQGNAKD